MELGFTTAATLLRLCFSFCHLAVYLGRKALSAPFGMGSWGWALPSLPR